MYDQIRTNSTVPNSCRANETNKFIIIKIKYIHIGLYCFLYIWPKIKEFHFN